MAEDSAALAETESSPSIDIDAAVNQISEGLFPEHEPVETTPQESVAEALTEKSAAPTKEIPPIPTVRQAPKSWAKDMHDHWGKTDPKVQDYIEKREKDFLDGTQQFRDAAAASQEIQKVLHPYQPMLQSKGLDAPKVIDDLMGTYARLTSGTMEQRQAALVQVAKNLGVAMPAANSTDQTQTIPPDPRLQTIEQQLQELRDAQTRQQQVALQAAQEKASLEVSAFISETEKDGKTPKHPFFDECYEDIVKLLKVGESLQDAYDKAVWANPVTREKQKSAYFQTESEKAKERARLDALPKQKARGVNVNGKDTQRAPTDPLGSMDDTLRSTLKEIKDRTVH